MTAQMVQDVLMFKRKKMKWINGGRNRARTCDPLIKSQRFLQFLRVSATVFFTN